MNFHEENYLNKETIFSRDIAINAIYYKQNYELWKHLRQTLLPQSYWCSIVGSLQKKTTADDRSIGHFETIRELSNCGHFKARLTTKIQFPSLPQDWYGRRGQQTLAGNSGLRAKWCIDQKSNRIICSTSISADSFGNLCYAGRGSIKRVGIKGAF